jgi:predicted alpha/beta hydrolase family esterase
MTRILLLPGLYDSGPDHWQSHWERTLPDATRVVQRDWETPARAEWVATLERAVEESGPDTVLVGHSTGCALIAFWAAETTRTVRGALLVAPSDTERAGYPKGPTGWRPMPMSRLPFPSIVVASTNDEYASLDRARDFAEAWGSSFLNIGAVGHINSASQLGDWPGGRKLLGELMDAPAP